MYRKKFHLVVLEKHQAAQATGEDWENTELRNTNMDKRYGEKSLKVRREAVDFPVTVTGWLWPTAAADFLWLFGRMPLAFSAPCRGFRQGPFSRRRQRALGWQRAFGGCLHSGLWEL